MIDTKIDKFVEAYIMSHLTDIEEWKKINAIIKNIRNVNNGEINSSSEERKIGQDEIDARQPR